jgi:hypothetical protein
MTTKYISTTGTAKLIRKALKESFPGVKFSVRSDVYSGGSSINVSWTDGPTSKMVEAVAKTFQGAYFDGMQDYKGSTFAMIDGEQVRFGADFVFCERRTTRAFLERVKAAAIRMYGEKFAAVEIKDSSYDNTAYFDRTNAVADERNLSVLRSNFTTYLTPRRSPTAGKVIYLGNDGYSDKGALSVH